MHKTEQMPYFLFVTFTITFIASSIVSTSGLSPPPAAAAAAANYSVLPPDSLALLAFKSKADLHNNLHFVSHKRFDFCFWSGVKCSQSKVVQLVLQRLPLGGTFEPDTLSRLDQLQVLTLQNTSLTGPIPDLSNLTNLKTLFLDHNFFSGSFPPSIPYLHRLTILDLSNNNLTGPIPNQLTQVDWIYCLRLDSNQFNGTIPPFNQSYLQIFNVSNNNLTGVIPLTPTLARFNLSSFAHNLGLCGEIVSRNCGLKLPFFNPSRPSPPPSNQVHLFHHPTTARSVPKKHTSVIVAAVLSSLLAIGFIIIAFIIVMKKKPRRRQRIMMPPEENAIDMRKMEAKESANLIFCQGGGEDYTVEQLMRGSAEMLGRGTIGTTYKAVLDNQVVVCVKRLDVGKSRICNGEMFERHIDVVGKLRHPNLVPLRAYFQAKEERLLIYDYQANGSIFSLVHGLRSTRAKPLHWTSCLKIAEDVADGLVHIHQTSNLVHGNLKASNVLLGDDFEARLTDYCLYKITNTCHDQDADFAGYKAPEILNSTTHTSPFTTKSDVYAFGVLLMELLTSKPPSQHPFLMSTDVLNWVRHARSEKGGCEDNRLEMLVDIATTCSRTSPEKRPSMWQVLEMIQEIKEIVTRESDSSFSLFS